MIKLVKLVGLLLTPFCVSLFVSLVGLRPATGSISLAALPATEREGGVTAGALLSPAQQTPGVEVWRDINEVTLRDQGGQRLIIPRMYRLVAANMAELDRILAQAPPDADGSSALAGRLGVVLALPLPDGAFGRFRVEAAALMEAALAARFPEIKTYRGWGLDDPTATAWLDRTPAGFHAMILAGSGTTYLDPYRQGDIVHYLSYFKRDYSNIWGKTRQGEVILDSSPAGASGSRKPAAASSGPTLRTYQLAIAATGEYTMFHGGTVTGALAAINTTLNRVNGIYEREVAVRLILVANTDQLIYTNPVADPYSNNNGNTMLAQNQMNLDAVIGSIHYDIGHVFSTGGGGIAWLRGVCNTAVKAGGVTGSAAPVGDPFDVDYVAHEMGHQFGARHTFNGTAGACEGNRSIATAYEPGSGSTIMAYAGICESQDLQPHSDDYFHGISFDEIMNFIGDPGPSGADSCASKSATGNDAPVVEAGPSYTVPRQTPFTLSGSATDPNGDALTYQWEEFDLGDPPSDPTSLPNTDGDGQPRPIFRSYEPGPGDSRTLPELTSILINTNFNSGEALPTIGRTMQFRLTARDQRGGVNSDQMGVSVVSTAGPFRVTLPTAGTVWTPLTQAVITWEVAQTTAAPISCSRVNILLSLDGGQTFSSLLADHPNDGLATLTVPAGDGTSTARIKVACADNIFFDISDAGLRIEAGGVSIYLPTVLKSN